MRPINVFGVSLDRRLVIIFSVTTCLVLLIFLSSPGSTSFVRYIQSGTNSIAQTGEVKSVCKDKTKHFVLVKIEKTGTSTLFGTLARFAMSHGLNILTPTKSRLHITWTGENEGKGSALKGKWAIGPEAVDRADVLLNHARYNKSIFDKYLKRDYKLIVPVREPVSWMRSAINHFASNARIKESTPDEIIGNSSLLFKERPEGLSGLKTWFHLPQLQRLGFDYDKRGSLTEIQNFIDDFLPRIDIPIINDQYDASLLIMKKRFCWDYTDIFYKSHNVRRSFHVSLSPESIKKIPSLEMNLGDKLLYEAVNRTWWQQPELKERDFWKEVTYFSKLNQEVSTKHCPAVLKNEAPHTVEATQYHQVLSITKSLCMTMNDGIVQQCAKKYVEQTPCDI